MSDVRSSSGGFFIVRNDLFPSIVKDVGPTGFAVYCWLLRGPDNGRVCLLRERLAESIGCSVKDVKDALQNLRNCGYISITPGFGDCGRLHPRHYIIEDMQ